MTIKQLKERLKDLQVPDEVQICYLDISGNVVRADHFHLQTGLREDDLGSDLGKFGTIILT